MIVIASPIKIAVQDRDFYWDCGVKQTADPDFLVRTKGDGLLDSLVLYWVSSAMKSSMDPRTCFAPRNRYGRSMQKNRLFERPQDASSGFSSAPHSSARPPTNLLGDVVLARLLPAHCRLGPFIIIRGPGAL